MKKIRQVVGKFSKENAKNGEGRVGSDTNRYLISTDQTVTFRKWLRWQGLLVNISNKRRPLEQIRSAKAQPAAFNKENTMKFVRFRKRAWWIRKRQHSNNACPQLKYRFWLSRQNFHQQTSFSFPTPTPGSISDIVISNRIVLTICNTLKSFINYLSTMNENKYKTYISKCNNLKFQNITI